jgi:hypothetical protein
MMGYSRNYVGNVEQEVLPVTAAFARRFWAVVGNSELSRIVPAVVPLRFDVVDRPVRILHQPRSCECGCGIVFVPSSSRHRFVSKKHGKRRRRKIS